MKMEQTECSETLAYKIQTPWNYPEESMQHSDHRENLKSRKCHTINNQGLDCKFSDSIHVCHICVNMSVVLVVLSKQNFSGTF